MQRDGNIGLTFFDHDTNTASTKSDTPTIKTIPYFPPNGDIADIADKENCALVPLTDIEVIAAKINLIHEQRPEHNDDRYSKHLLATRFNIVRKDKELYAIYHMLGKGSNGRVKAVQNIRTGKWRAMKIIPVAKQTFSSDQEVISALTKTESATTEYQNLVMLGETNSLELIGKRKSAIKNPLMLASLRPDKDEIQWNILMDLAEGIPLSHYCDNTYGQAVLPTHCWLQIALDVIQALKELHQHPAHPMLHCDIKPDNIMYDLAGRRAKLIDKGFSLQLDNNEIQEAGIRGSFTHWTSLQRLQWKEFKLKRSSATEPVSNKMCFNKATDIHALVITLAELLGLFEPPKNPASGKEFKEFLNNLNPDITYIVTKDHPHYLTNQRITDENIREKILDYLQRAATASLSAMPTLDNLTEFFSSMQSASLLAENHSKIGILDVNEYLHLTSENKIKILEYLKSMHEVQLIATASHSDFEYMKVRWELQQAGIRAVGSQVYVGQNREQLMEKVRTDLNTARFINSFEIHDAHEQPQIINLAYRKQ